MAISPWAQVDQQNAPPPPGVLTPVNLPGGDTMPQVFAPSSQHVIWNPPNSDAPPPMAPLEAPKLDLHKNLAPIFAPAPEPTVGLDPNPQHQVEGHLTNQLQRDYAKDAAQPQGFWGKLTHALNHATGGDTRRGWEEQGLAKQINDVMGDESTNAYRGAEQAHTQEQTKDEAANEPLKERLEGAQADEAEQKANAGPDLAQAYAHAVNQAVLKGTDPGQDPVVQHLADAITNIQKQSNTTKGLDHVSLQDQKGKPYAATYDPNKGEYRDAAGSVIANPVPYEKPQVTNNHFEEHEGDKGRALLDKGEAQYRTAEQGAQGIRGMIDDALQGGKISARMLPLEGALEVTTANGVKRINRTEVDQYAGGGSLFDRLAGQIGGATKGIPFTPEIMNDMKRLADVQEKGAYDNYKGGYDSATRRYHLTDEQALPAPSASAGPAGSSGQPQRPANVPQGYQFNANGPKGAGWYAPTAK